MTTATAPAPPSSPPRAARTTRPGLARSVLSNWAVFLISAAVNFLVAPVVVRGLGDARYGVWVLIGSLVGYLGLLDLGVRGAVTRYVARLHAAADDVAASRITSTALGLFTLTGLIAIALAVTFTLLLGNAFDVPPELVRSARAATMIAGINIAVALVTGVFGGVAVSLERFDLLNVLEISLELLRAALILVALAGGFGLVSLAAIQLGCSLVRLAVQAGLVRHLYPALRISYALCGRAEARLIVTLGLTTMALHAAGMLAFYTDAFVIGAFLPVAMITFFANGANLTNYARSVISGISQVVSPRASFLEQTGGPNAIHQMLLSSGRLATLVILPITLTFMLRGRTFIDLWMGPTYGEASGQVLTILSVALTFAAGRQIVSTALMGLNRHKGLIPIYCAEGVVNLGLSIALVGPFGINGVAWGTALPNLAVSLVFVPWYARRVLGVPVRQQLVHFWMRPLAAAIPFAATTFAIERLWPTPGLFMFFGQVAVALLAAAAGTWIAGLTREERKAFRDRWRSWRPLHRAVEPRPRIAVLGHVGNGNLGDEAIIAATIANVRDTIVDADIIAFTSNPRDTTERHGVPAFSLYRESEPITVDGASTGTDGGGARATVKRAIARVPPLFAALRGLRNGGLLLVRALTEVPALWTAWKRLRGVRLLIVAGSGQVNDYYGGVWRYPYGLLKWTVLTRLRGGKVAYVSVGAGPVFGRFSRLLLRIALSLAAYRSFRDENSLQTAAELGIRRDNHLVRDLAFSLPGLEITRRSGGRELRVVINPLPYQSGGYWHEANQHHYHDYVQNLATFTEHLVARGHCVTFVPTQIKVDPGVIAEVLALLPAHVRSTVREATLRTVDDLVRALAEADVVVATRYHGVLLSLLLGKPTIGIAYHPKTHDLLRAFGQERFAVPVEGLDVSSLDGRFEALVRDADGVRAGLGERRAAISGLVRGQFAELARIADRPRAGAT